LTDKNINDIIIYVKLFYFIIVENNNKPVGHNLLDYTNCCQQFWTSQFLIQVTTAFIYTGHSHYIVFTYIIIHRYVFIIKKLHEQNNYLRTLTI